MCGIVGMVAREPVNQALYDALMVLQHRGQDAAGIVTCDGGRVYLRKDRGLVRDVFQAHHMLNLRGNVGVGHARYPTAGCTTSAEAQPFYVNSPYGIILAHNGNLTNVDDLKRELFAEDLRHINTDSDSEVLLNVFAHELAAQGRQRLQPADIFQAVSRVHTRCTGGYAVVAMIVGHGLVAFRDPHAIRPIVYGTRQTPDGVEYMVASESVALDVLGFDLAGSIRPGEAIYVTDQGNSTPPSVPRHPTTHPASSSSSIWRGPIPSSTACRCTRRGCAWVPAWPRRSCGSGGRTTASMWSYPYPIPAVRRPCPWPMNSA